MSKGIVFKKYYIIGPFPPPLGGVSVFSYRLKKQLEKEEQKVISIDFSKMNRFQLIKFIFSAILNPTPVLYYFNTAHGIKLMPWSEPLAPDKKIRHS